jgi:hypothetical protein
LEAEAEEEVSAGAEEEAGMAAAVSRRAAPFPPAAGMALQALSHRADGIAPRALSRPADGMSRPAFFTRTASPRERRTASMRRSAARASIILCCLCTGSTYRPGMSGAITATGVAIMAAGGDGTAADGSGRSGRMIAVIRRSLPEMRTRLRSVGQSHRLAACQCLLIKAARFASRSAQGLTPLARRH